jgi:hypothetical protein
MTRLVATLLLTAPGLKISVSWDRQRRRVPEASTSVRGGRRTRAEPLWKRHPIHCAIYVSPKWHAYLKTNQIRCIGRGGSE